MRWTHPPGAWPSPLMPLLASKGHTCQRACLKHGQAPAQHWGWVFLSFFWSFKSSLLKFCPSKLWITNWTCNWQTFHYLLLIFSTSRDSSNVTWFTTSRFRLNEKKPKTNKTEKYIKIHSPPYDKCFTHNDPDNHRFLLTLTMVQVQWPFFQICC